MTSLATLHCQPSVSPLSHAEVDRALPDLPGWAIEDGKIVKVFFFGNYHETMAFVNAVAWIAHREDHHPDMVVGYDRCRVEYHTHSVGGLSLNDLICAARIEALGSS